MTREEAKKLIKKQADEIADLKKRVTDLESKPSKPDPKKPEPETPEPEDDDDGDFL